MRNKISLCVADGVELNLVEMIVVYFDPETRLEGTVNAIKVPLHPDPLPRWGEGMKLQKIDFSPCSRWQDMKCGGVKLESSMSADCVRPSTWLGTNGLVADFGTCRGEDQES